jgi:hypothetical protein
MKKKLKTRQNKVDDSTNKRIIGPVAKAVNARLKQLGKSKLWLVKKTGMRTATLYDFLSGKRDMRSDKVETVLAALGLEIRPKR